MLDCQFCRSAVCVLTEAVAFALAGLRVRLQQEANDRTRLGQVLLDLIGGSNIGYIPHCCQKKKKREKEKRLNQGLSHRDDCQVDKPNTRVDAIEQLHHTNQPTTTSTVHAAAKQSVSQSLKKKKIFFGSGRRTDVLQRMPKSKTKAGAYAQMPTSPAATPERQRADKKRAGKRDDAYRPSKHERILSEGGSLTPGEELKMRREVQREVDDLLDVHKKAPKRDNRYVPTKAELSEDASMDQEDAKDTTAEERKEKKSVRRDLFSLLGKHKKAPPRDDRYTPSKEEIEQDAEDEKEDTKLRLRRFTRLNTRAPKVPTMSKEKKRAIAKGILLQNKEAKMSLLDHSADTSNDGESSFCDDESLDDPSLPVPQQGTATPVKGNK